MIKVSIIIPVYNVELWLRDCLDSAINQSLKEIEIICVNDASTDGSLKILEEYASKDNRIRIINQKVNIGLSGVRNIGAAYATGEYLYFFDSDDKLKFNAMEVLHKRASTDRLEVLCFEGETIFDKDELITKYNYQKRWCERSREYSGVKTGRELFVQMISNDDYKVVVWILFINRAFYVNNSLAFVPQILFEDNVFTFELFLRANRVGHIFEKLYVRRVREGSITTSQFTFERVYGFFVCITKCKEILEDSCLSEKEKSFFYQEIDRLLWCCKNEYKKLSGGEAEKYLLLPITQTKLLKYLIVDICKIEQENLVLKKKIKIVENKHRELFQKYNILDKENSYNIKKLVEIKVGWSFRIGRVITFIPRKIRELFKR